ncbi:MAG: hypothetical protein AAF531_06290 [Actinomycetota bacterium]
MARPREFNTDEAMTRIADVFWGAGFEPTSITDLEEATGLARARLYAAFGTKHDMLYRSIDHYLEGPLEMVFRTVDDGGLDGISGWFRRIAQLRATAPERALKGCLVVNSLVEFGDTDPEINQRGDRYRARVLHAFRSALEAAEQDGVITGDVEERTNVALLLLLGIFVSIKSGAEAATITALADAAVSVVESWRLEPSNRYSARTI